MTENDSRLVAPGDLALAFALLTRLPVPAPRAGRQALAAWAYPLVGIVVAGLAALAGGLALTLGLPAPLAALAALFASVMLTGAMHEDGLADTADGLWGGWDRARRLEIMRDSRIGTYGVIALVLGLAARWSALWMLFETGTGLAAAALIVAGTVSRASMPALMAGLPHARESGLSRSVGPVTARTAVVAAGLAAATAVILMGWPGLGALIWAALAAAAMAALARARIGGQTGDILGATQQVVEIAVLLSLLA